MAQLASWLDKLDFHRNGIFLFLDLLHLRTRRKSTDFDGFGSTIGSNTNIRVIVKCTWYSCKTNWIFTETAFLVHRLNSLQLRTRVHSADLALLDLCQSNWLLQQSNWLLYQILRQSPFECYIPLRPHLSTISKLHVRLLREKPTKEIISLFDD
jgi:hypothetical protein